MARQRTFVRTLSVLAILSLLLSAAAPIAQAQDTSTAYLPVAASPGAAGIFLLSAGYQQTGTSL